MGLAGIQAEVAVVGAPPAQRPSAAASQCWFRCGKGCSGARTPEVNRHHRHSAQPTPIAGLVAAASLCVAAGVQPECAKGAAYSSPVRGRGHDALGDVTSEVRHSGYANAGRVDLAEPAPVAGRKADGRLAGAMQGQAQGPRARRIRCDAYAVRGRCNSTARLPSTQFTCRCRAPRGQCQE